MAVLIALHALAAVLWVGGLFFMLVILRPAVADVPMGERVPVLVNALARFFAWVWGAIAVILATGYAMTFMLGAVPVYVYVMQTLAWIMILLFVGLFFGPWQSARSALADGQTKGAVQALGHVRWIATVNLVLGVVTVVVAVGGRYGLYRIFLA